MLLLHHTATDCDDMIRMTFFYFFDHAKLSEKTVVSVFSDAARIDDDHISVLPLF